MAFTGVHLPGCRDADGAAAALVHDNRHASFVRVTTGDVPALASLVHRMRISEDRFDLVRQIVVPGDMADVPSSESNFSRAGRLIWHEPWDVTQASTV